MKTPHIVLTRCLLSVALFLSVQTACGFYDPTVQRWVNRDPIGEDGFEALRQVLWETEGLSLNEHTFVINNPITQVDSFGLDSIDVSIGVAIANGDAVALETLAGSGALTAAQAARVAAALRILKGAKSLSEYCKHLNYIKQHLERLKKLRELLQKTKSPKVRKTIEEEIERETKQMKGHEKEINQKWPDGRPGGE